jgi:hypothetical protein
MTAILQVFIKQPKKRLEDTNLVFDCYFDLLVDALEASISSIQPLNYKRLTAITAKPLAASHSPLTPSRKP